MRGCRTNRWSLSRFFLAALLILLAGCSSAVVKGLLEYPDKSTSTAGDSVHVRLYGSESCGATILNVGEDHRWQYPPKNKKRDLRLWSRPLPPLNGQKGQEAPTFVFQAMKIDGTDTNSTQIAQVRYATYKALPKADRLIILSYERMVGSPPDTSGGNKDSLQSPPR